MKSVITLICNPAAPVLTESVLARVSDAITDALAHDRPGAAYQLSMTTLEAETAVDFETELPGSEDVSGPESARLAAARAQTALEGAPVDIVLQSAEHRKKRLLIADMDSTIIQQECIDELAEFAGLRAEISAITERAMRGELNFEAALKERVAMLKGLNVSVLERAFKERITLTPGARSLVRTMNARGGLTALVSGGFTFFTQRVAQAVEFQRQQANELLIDGEALSGAVAEPILGRDAKEQALIAYAAEARIGLEQTLAVGDGANDLAMIGRAGLGVAFRAKPATAEAADARIDHGDLTALLYLQGLRRSEFVED